jgi:hypothetical protein
MLRAVDRGEMSHEELLDIMTEHLATLCSGCAEVLAAHEARLARGEDPVPSRETFKWELLFHMLTWRERICNHHVDHRPS